MLVRLAVDFGPCTIDEDLVGLQGLVRALGRPRVVEVGSWLGRTALAMVEAGAESVHCVDTWRGTRDPADETFEHANLRGRDELLRAFCLNVGQCLGRTIFPYIGSSRFWAECWPWRADLVFLDADHSYEATRNAIAAWQPIVNHGGVICGHDFSDAWPGVKRAVSESGPFKVMGECVWARQL